SPGSIEGLAALHIARIRAVQPRGPYQLLGWSMGGVIAVEMARQLRLAGETVAPVMLIDSYTPDAVRQLEQEWLQQKRLPGADKETPLLAGFARDLGIPDGLLEPAEGAAGSDLEMRLELLLQQATEAGFLTPDIDRGHVRSLFARYMANVSAMNSYKASPYRGDAVLILAADGRTANP